MQVSAPTDALIKMMLKMIALAKESENLDEALMLYGMAEECKATAEHYEGLLRYHRSMMDVLVWDKLIADISP